MSANSVGPEAGFYFLPLASALLHTAGQIVSAHGTALEASLQANSPSPSVGVAVPPPSLPLVKTSAPLCLLFPFLER